MKLFSLLAVTALVAACATDVQSDAPSGGIRGRAFIGPTCPVEPEGVPCRPDPFQGELSVRDADGEDVMATVETGSDGRFSVRLTPGRYVLASEGPGLPFLKPVAVTVPTHGFAEVTVYFDSGIR